MKWGIVVRRVLEYAFVALLLIPITSIAGSPAITKNAALFDVSANGSEAVIDFDVTEHRVYTFSLGFRFDGSEEKKRVAELAGSGVKGKDGRPINPGVKIPIEIQVFSLSDEGSPVLVLSNNKVTEGKYASGLGSGYHYRSIVGAALRKGRYRVHAVSQESHPELKGAKIYLIVGTYAKNDPLP